MASDRSLLVLATLVAVPLAAGVLTWIGHSQPALAAAQEPPGKQMFLGKKCNVCHSIDSQGIARTSKAEATKGPDLSNVGGAHLAPWIEEFLQQEVGNSEGKKHRKKWSGTDQELEQLAQWLATLKKA